MGTSRWLFPGYLAIIALFIPIIATAGSALFGQSDTAPDTYVIAIAVSSESILQALVFLGGLSAATAMIIVATLTLSTMVSNDVILPKLLTQNQRLQGNQSHVHEIYGYDGRLLPRF